MAQPKKTAKRPGPRPRGPFADKRRTLTTRITERTRAGLEKAAAASDRSLSQEIEFRLEQTLQRDGAEAREIEAAFGDRATYRLMVLLATTLGLVETVTGKKWHKDELTYQEAREAIDAFFERFRPGRLKPQGLLHRQDLGYGRRIAPMVLDTMLEKAGALKKERKSET